MGRQLLPTLGLKLVGTILLASAGDPTALGQSNSFYRRGEVISWLRHGEGLVQSTECQFKCVYSVSTPQTIALLKATFQRTENPQGYLAAVWTEEDVLRWTNSYVKKWWRKGALEREEVFGLNDDLSGPPRFIKAFDGQIVRSVNFDGEAGKITGTVDTMDSSGWNESNLQSPFSFLYEYFRFPYSQIVANAKSFTAQNVVVGAKPFIEVNLENAKPHFNGSLIFDQQHRLIERRLLDLPFPTFGGKKPILRQKHVFTGYQAQTDASGEIIWFPKEITYHYYIGYAPDGTLVETGTKTYTIMDIKFNVDIPDEKFDLKIPKDAKVWDGVTGLGWLPEGDRPAAVFPEEARQARWTAAAVVVSLLLIAGGTYWYWSRRKGTSAKT